MLNTTCTLCLLFFFISHAFLKSSMSSESILIYCLPFHNCVWTWVLFSRINTSIFVESQFMSQIFFFFLNLSMTKISLNVLTYFNFLYYKKTSRKFWFSAHSITLMVIFFTLHFHYVGCLNVFLFNTCLKDNQFWLKFENPAFHNSEANNADFFLI